MHLRGGVFVIADRDDDTPVVDAAIWRGIAYAIPAALLAWGIILGLGYLGYILGQLAR